MEIVSLPGLIFREILTYHSAKRMYNPQTYHHIQEIQKYNIQDYRPRYVFSLYYKSSIDTNSSNLAWSNSKKPFAKFAKSNVCANSVAMPSHKQMSRKQESSRRMTRRGKEGGMVRWQVRGRRLVGEVMIVCVNLKHDGVLVVLHIVSLAGRWEHWR
jgi:phospholipid-transporting ATPase